MLASIKKFIVRWLIIMTVLLIPIAYLKGSFDPAIVFVKGYNSAEAMAYAEKFNLENQNEVDSHREYAQKLQEILNHRMDYDAGYVDFDEDFVREAVAFINKNIDSVNYSKRGAYDIVTLSGGKYAGSPLQYIFTEDSSDTALKISTADLGFTGKALDGEVKENYYGSVQVKPERLNGVGNEMDSISLKVAKIQALIFINRDEGFNLPSASARILKVSVDDEAVNAERVRLVQAQENSRKELQQFRREQGCQRWAEALQSCATAANQRSCVRTRLGNDGYAQSALCNRDGTPTW